jgi:DNA-binding NtrC family response regulator
MIEQKQFREDLYYRTNVFPITIPPLRDRREDLPAMIFHFLKRSRLKLGRGPAEIAPDALQFLCRQPWQGNVRELENAIERACLLTKGPVLTSAFLSTGALTDNSASKNQVVSADLSVEKETPDNKEASVAMGVERVPATAEDSECNPPRCVSEDRAVANESEPNQTNTQPSPPQKTPATSSAETSLRLPWEADIENPLEVAERLTLKAVLDRCDWNFVRAAEVLKISRSTLYSKAARYDLRKSDDVSDASIEI